jgi:DNA-binding XRE family transcriptional regulator
MREVRLNTEREHERFIQAMETKMAMRDLDNKALADELGVSIKSIYNFRRDTSRKPSKYLAGKIATYLGMIPQEWR